MARTPQQPRAKATRDAIVEAGFICVAKHGVEAATTRQIIEIAGVSPGSFYEYFENKEKLFDAMFQRLVDDALAMVEPLLPTIVQMSIQDMVRALLANFDRFMRDNDELYLKCARDATGVNEKYFLEPAARLLQNVVAQHALHHPETMRIRDLPTMAYLVVNGGLALVLRYYTDPHPPISFERFSEGLAQFVGHYVTQENLLATKSG